MRFILAIAGLAAILWGGYWFIGSTAMERELGIWFDDRREEGWLAEAATIDTRGFPSRFDTTLTGIRMADPDTGWAWTAPFFQIFALSYRPNHVIAAFPPVHSVSTPDETIEIASESTKASVVFEPNSKLALDRTSFEIADLGLQSSRGWNVNAERVKFDTRQSDPSAHAHDIFLEGTNVITNGFLAELGKRMGLPEVIEGLRMDFNVDFDAPWDRLAVEVARPQPENIDLRLVRAQWGEMVFQAAGKLSVDRAGLASGEISIQAQNWKEMLELGASSGAIAPELVEPLQSGLTLLAAMSGNANYIDATFKLRNGSVSVGPFPIASLPPLKIR